MILKDVIQRFGNWCLIYKMWCKIIIGQRNFEENMFNFVVITVPADGPAGAFAGTMMTKSM